jgi:hypothetical protein
LCRLSAKSKKAIMSGPSFIPYYIDYNVKNVSKTIGASKKRVTFKFGFANRTAIDDGLVGAHCRGSEHEVVFVWSLNSGKRQVTVDGKDVHFSSSGQNGWTSDRTWQHVFSLKVPGFGGVFRCHLISQPAPQGTAVRPFDLRVAGVSIFKFNQIYQLGTPQMVIRKPGGGRSSYSSVSGEEEEAMSPEERRLLAAARLESMREFRKSQQQGGNPGAAGNGQGPPKQGEGEDLLMRFDDAETAPPMPTPQPMHPGAMVSSMTMSSEFNSSNSFPQISGPPQQQQQQYGGYPQQQQQQPGGYPQQQQQQPPQYGQPYGGGYGNQPPAPQSQQSFGGSTATAPTANTTAMTPYQAPPDQAQTPSGYSNYSYGGSSFGGGSTAPTTQSTQAPAPAFSVSSLDPYAKPPADPWATPAPAPPPAPAAAPYGQQPPQQQQQYGAYPQQQQQMGQYQLNSPTADTQASGGTYGSAPGFAMPPQQQQQQQQWGQPPPQQQQYGQQPMSNPYAAPPQYSQQQQYQQQGF